MKNRKLVILVSAALTIVIFLTLFFTHSYDVYRNPISPFYVGVEYAYGYNNETAQIQLDEVKALVDKVKDYTNLFVIGSLGLTFDREVLTEACDYIVNANLNLIVLFTGLTEYSVEKLGEKSYNTTAWMVEAKTRYGARFLGIYRYDEPGGNQLDQGPSALVTKEEVNENNFTYTEIADHYVANLGIFPTNYLLYAPRVFTADYGLYWFDYNASYSAIFAEFVGNESKERHIALCRGAANTFSKDWGTIITWKYDQDPYLESPEELYNDLALAYRTGAKYAIVFSYPKINSSDYGILAEGHFKQLERFWTDIHHYQEFGSSKPEAAYILPANYGFGFRSPEDTIWGLFGPDDFSKKIYEDVERKLVSRFGSNFDILYDQPPLSSQLLQGYSHVFYWNQTIT